MSYRYNRKAKRLSKEELNERQQSFKGKTVLNFKTTIIAGPDKDGTTKEYYTNKNGALIGASRFQGIQLIDAVGSKGSFANCEKIQNML